jgi:hypothetical protein
MTYEFYDFLCRSSCETPFVEAANLDYSFKVFRVGRH